MICDGAVLQILQSAKSGPIRKGIATSSPEATLDVNGDIKIGDSSATCNGTTEGSMRYNSTDKAVEVCNGTSWLAMQASACDNAPAYLTFPSLTAQSTSTLVESAIVAVTGMDASCTVNVGVAGSGSPNYRTCSNSDCSTVLQAWTAANNTLDIQGNYIQLRTTTSASTDTSFSVTLTTGAITHDWIAATGVTVCGVIGSVCADGTVYAGLTSGTPFYVTRCDSGMSWGGASCDGARSNHYWNDGLTDYTTTGVIDLDDGQANTASLITIDSNSVTAGTQDHLAAQHCADLVLHGKSDWYLPAKNELGTIYTNSAVIGGFTTVYYWSSVETTSSNARRMIFNDGSSNSLGKNYASYIRCARHD